MDAPTLELIFFIMANNELPPIKIAVLIDGGFFVKRFNHLYNSTGSMSGEQVADALYSMAMKHVGRRNILYRIFYYDCLPLSKKFHNPISKKAIDFSTTPEYKFRMSLIEALKQKRKVALRLGTLKDNGAWSILPAATSDLLKGKIKFEDLKPEDVAVSVRQKGIDMKIGVDIASLALKKFVDCIVLFSGDSDFVPAAKLARMEGVDFILDPMQANVEALLFEHIDGLKSVSPTLLKSSTSKTKVSRKKKAEPKKA